MTLLLLIYLSKRSDATLNLVFRPFEGMLLFVNLTCLKFFIKEMGVRGLFSFLKPIEEIWTTIELREKQLVIDGSALCNSLYDDNGLDRRCGGQYNEFYDIIESFFQSLSSVGVESFVVLDGANISDNKLDTYKKRSEERIQTADMLAKNPAAANKDVFVYPLLLNFVFTRALRDLGVKFAVSDW